MLNEAMAKHNALYSELLSLIVDLHNYHYACMKKKDPEVGRRFRGCIKKIISVEKQLHRSSIELYDARRQDTKDTLVQKREERAYRKANPLKAGRPRKIRNDINTTN